MSEDSENPPADDADCTEFTRQLAEAEKALRFFVTAYLLEIAGILEEPLAERLSVVSKELGRAWQTDVERQHGLSFAFARNLYAVLLENFLPHEAVAFMLRGLGFAYPEPFVEEMLSSTPTQSWIMSRAEYLKSERREN